MYKINIYCDESCHLLNDHNDVMVLGAISCTEKEKFDIYKQIKTVKKEHGISNTQELKWTKISSSNVELYKAIIDVFFNSNLSFRGLVAHGKSALNHSAYKQTHDDWYYKMYFRLLDPLLDLSIFQYRIYLDIKDSKSSEKTAKLKSVLLNNHKKNIDLDIQVIRSHESQLIQLADIFIGALAYKSRHLNTSKAKLEIIDYIESMAEKNISYSTNRYEPKFNLFHWSPKEVPYEKM